MTRWIAIFVMTVFLTSGSVFAQTKRFELFVAYSPMRNFSNIKSENSETLHGWNASFNTRVRHWIGVTADFSGHYDGQYLTPALFYSNGQLSRGYLPHSFMKHSIMAGPQLKANTNHWEPYVHALFGISRVSIEPIPSAGLGFHDTDFAWILGGGLDLKTSNKLEIRLIQADYLHSDTVVGCKSLRTSFGLVFRF